MKKAMKNTFPHNPSDWVDYADEHILFIRALDQAAPSIFETVRIKRNPFGAPDAVKCRHEVIFIDEYLADEARGLLNRILTGFGYADLDDFVMQNATTGEFVYDANGKLDRKNSPGYIIDLWLLASLIAESHGDEEGDTAEITMREAAALALFEKITGVTNVKCIGGVTTDATTEEGSDGKHISEVKEGDHVLYDGHVYTATGDAYMTGTDYGKEWNFEVESDYGPETYLYASYFKGGIVTLAPSIVVRNAKCCDCTHHFCENEGDPAMELCGCEAKGWEDTDSEHPAWKADCGHFCYEGYTGERCFQVVQSVAATETEEKHLEPVGYVVAENCVTVNEEAAKEILKQVKGNRLLDESAIEDQAISYENLGLYWWDNRAKEFTVLLMPDEKKD